MTVSYTGGLIRQLFRWKGSVWKALWLDILIFLVLYYSISFTYMFAMNRSQQVILENVSRSVAADVKLIPLQYLLGFFINQIVQRWWKQFRTVSWPENLLMQINGCLSGPKYRRDRRAIARWTNLVSALAWGKRSVKIRKRFPTTNHLILAGLMTAEEKDIYDSYTTPYDKWWMPTLWILGQLRKCQEAGAFPPSIYRFLVDEIVKWRENFHKMLHYNWISFPLVYTQVVTVATYGYMCLCLIGRQLLVKSPIIGYNAPVYVPFPTILQFIFYLGWLKVGEALIDPFGEDDEDFELNWILDRNLYVGYMMVDFVSDQLPSPFNEIPTHKLPHTKASAKLRETGAKCHLNKIKILEKDMALVIDPDCPRAYLPENLGRFRVEESDAERDRVHIINEDNY